MKGVWKHFLVGKHSWTNSEIVTGKMDGVVSEIVDQEGSEIKRKAERLPVTGIDTMKIRVQRADVHTHAYVRTVQYKSREW